MRKRNEIEEECAGPRDYVSDKLLLEVLLDIREYQRIAAIEAYIGKQKKVTTTEEQEIKTIRAKGIKLKGLQLDLRINNITKRLKEQKNGKEETNESKEGEN